MLHASAPGLLAGSLCEGTVLGCGSAAPFPLVMISAVADCDVSDTSLLPSFAGSFTQAQDLEESPSVMTLPL